jgi:hypothetical protein
MSDPPLDAGMPLRTARLLRRPLDHKGTQPVRGDSREAVQGVARGLTHPLQPVKGTNGRQHMRRIGALAAAGSVTYVAR